MAGDLDMDRAGAQLACRPDGAHPHSVSPSAPEPRVRESLGNPLSFCREGWVKSEPRSWEQELEAEGRV